RRPFLVSEEGTLTYGDLVAAPTPQQGQVVVEPDASLSSVVELMAPGDRQLVVLEPALPGEERARRMKAAAAGRSRRARTILFTSGTTGPAKGVRLTAANWEAATAASATHLAHRPEDVWLAAMPLHHVGGIAILYRSAYVGSTVRWVPRFDPVEVAAAMREDVTIASLVPTMLRRVLDADSGAYTGLRAVLIGGGPIPPGLIEEAHRRGIPALPTYGMTETCAQVATLRPGSRPRHAAHPLPGIEIRIDDGGQIQVRGEQVSPGYVDEEDRPVGEWFTTRDLGEIEPDGAIRVVGRADDVIVTGGENVSPDRVEATLAAHPGVLAAAVTGLTDDEWGETVVAVYQGSAPLEEVRDWLRHRLAPYEVPRQIRVVHEIPTSSGGKPDMDRIRDLFGG
ncbi:MAG TPA: AMP-binding protein, partial [Acidimicrobiia bacterium]|nr:AMP-binding protein [Acidimicrobiia bacterium]